MLTWARAGLIPLAAAIAIAAGDPGPQAPQPLPLKFPPRDGTYLVLPIEAIDGDTVRFYWLIEDVGRLRGINAPELHGPDADKGKAAKVFLAGKLPARPTPATMDGREKYGRALLTLFGDDGKSLNRLMIDAGQAVPYLEDR